MSRRWIRLDVEWDESGWIDALSGEAAGCWPRLLCWVKLRGKGGTCRMPDIGALARRWRVKRQAVVEMIEAAKADGALVAEDGQLTVAKWATYQEPDSTTTQRKRKQREREVSRVSRRDDRDNAVAGTAETSHFRSDVTDVTRDTGVTRHVTTDHRPPNVVEPDPPTTGVEGPPSPFAGLLPGFEAAVAVLDGWKHGGGPQQTFRSLAARFLYPDGQEPPIAEPRLAGRTLEQRRLMVATSVMELAERGNDSYSSRGLAAFLRDPGSPIKSAAPKAKRRVAADGTVLSA